MAKPGQDDLTPRQRGQGGSGILAIAVAVGLAVGAAGLFMSGGIPDLPGLPGSPAADASADVAAVSRPLADVQNITIITGANSPVTLTLSAPAPVPLPVESVPEADSPVAADAIVIVDEPPAAIDIARNNIREHEGYSSSVYELYGLDHVCFGHQVLPDEAAGARSVDECLSILNDDLILAEMAAAEFAAGVWPEMSRYRQAVLIELGYVLGWSGLFDFVNMRLAIQRGDWQVAADELGLSRLPEQVAPERLGDWQARLLGS